MRCPKCKSPLEIPKAQAVEKTSAGGVIKFRCPNCNQKIGIAPEYAGKRVRCAKCKNPMTIPQAPDQDSGPAAKDPTDILKAGNEQSSADNGLWNGFGDMDDLLAAEANAPSAERPMESKRIDSESQDSEISASSGWPQQGQTGGNRPKKSRNHSQYLKIFFDFIHESVIAHWSNKKYPSLICYAL